MIDHSQDRQISWVGTLRVRKTTVFISEAVKVTNTELVQREMFFTESQPIICLMKGVSIRNLGKMFQDVGTALTCPLWTVEHRSASSQVRLKSQSYPCPTPGQEFCYFSEERPGHKCGGGRGGTFGLRSQVCHTRKSWVAPIEAKGRRCRNLSIYLDPMWNPPQVRVGLREPRILKSRGCLLEFLQQICSDVGPQSR